MSDLTTPGSAQPAAAQSGDVLAGLRQIQPWLEDLYRYLHAHPELSMAEYGTAARIIDELHAMPGASEFEVITEIAGIGVAAVITNSHGPTVMLRADMDGLPVKEDTGLDYASTVEVENRSGEVTAVMHACGHDVHVSALLGALRLLLATRTAWSGTIVALFQPAEEQYNGALAMLADGLTQRLPRPDVALGQHVFPGASGTVAISPGPVMAGSCDFTLTVRGRGGHGAAPHLAIDPVVMAASLVLRFQALVARQVPPQQTAVLTVGKISAGTKSNIIADHAVLEGTIRAYDDAVAGDLLAGVERAARAEAACWGAAEPHIQTYDRLPVTDNDPGVTDRVTQAFCAEFGAAKVGEFEPMMGAEDFSEVPNAWGAPYCYWSIGAFDEQAWRAAEAAGTQASDFADNHSAQFAPVMQPTLNTGVRALVAATLAWCGKAPHAS